LNEAGAQKYGMKDTVKQKVKMLGSIRVLQTHLRRCVRAAAALLTCARPHASNGVWLRPLQLLALLLPQASAPHHASQMNVIIIQWRCSEPPVCLTN
jgi:hypothetical protein